MKRRKTYDRAFKDNAVVLYLVQTKNCLYLDGDTGNTIFEVQGENEFLRDD